MNDKVVVITGASTGLGLATATLAAAAGHTVVATMRDVESAKSTPLEGLADVRQLDVTDAESIDRCVRGVVETHGRIDTIVNNAGWAHTLPTIEVCPMDRYRAGFEVNFFGVVAVTKAAMPHLRDSQGRLITIGSTRGLIAAPSNEGYSAAKFAVEGFMESLSFTAAQMGVSVSLIVPGPILQTQFAASSGSDRAELLDMAGPYHDTLEAYLDYVASTSFPGAQTASEVAKVVVDTISDPDPAFRVTTSDWAHDYAANKVCDIDGRHVQQMAAGWFAEGRRAR